MMIAEQELPCEFLAGFFGAPGVIDAAGLRQFRANQIRHPKLFFHPQRHRFEERAEAGGSVIEISFQQPVEFQQRLVIESHVIKLLSIEAGFDAEQLDYVAFYDKPLLKFRSEEHT